jgi:acyl-CoA thioester hydrolase
VQHLQLSVRYEIGIFQKDSEEAAAYGHFVHVFVDRKSNQPISIPPKLRKVMEDIKRE